MPYKCKRTRCDLCCYPYCIDNEPNGEDVKREYLEEQKAKTEAQRKREAWRRWYERNKESEQQRGRENHRRKHERSSNDNADNMLHADNHDNH